jgi:hypothetical protein
MKQLAFTSALALSLAAAACGKSSDLRPLKEETVGMIVHYAEQVSALELRRQDLIQRGATLLQKDEARPVKAQLDVVSTQLLPGLQTAVKAAPSRIDGVEKDGKLDDPGKVAALRAYASETEERLADGWMLANAKLDAVEAWLTRAEARPAAAPQPAPLPPGGASPAPTQPTGDAAGAAGAAGGGAAGTYPMGTPQQGSAADNAAK